MLIRSITRCMVAFYFTLSAGGCAPSFFVTSYSSDPSVPAQLAASAVSPVTFNLGSSNIVLGRVSGSAIPYLDRKPVRQTCNAGSPCFTTVVATVERADSGLSYAAYFKPERHMPTPAPLAVERHANSRVLKRLSRGTLIAVSIEQEVKPLLLPDNANVTPYTIAYYLPIRIPVRGELLDGLTIALPNNHENYLVARLKFSDPVLLGEVVDLTQQPNREFKNSVPRPLCRNAVLEIALRDQTANGVKGLGENLVTFNVVVADTRYAVLESVSSGMTISFDGHCRTRTGGNT